MLGWYYKDMKSAMLVVAFLLMMAPAHAAEQIQWLRKYDQAVAESKKDSHPIFVDVYADWCIWCHKLDKEVYTDPKFIEYIKGFVALKIDSEDNGEGTRLAEKYGIDGLPAMLILDANGNLLNKLSGYMDAKEMIQGIQHVQSLLELERKNPKNEEANFLLAREYLDREMYAQAEQRFQRTVKSPTASAVQKERALYSAGLAEYYQGNVKRALNTLEDYYAIYPDGASNEDALLLLSQLHIELKSNAKALKYLREFMRKYPKSSNANRAREVLTALEKES
jgi:thioredoxin-related protein